MFSVTFFYLQENYSRDLETLSEAQEWARWLETQRGASQVRIIEHHGSAALTDNTDKE